MELKDSVILITSAAQRVGKGGKKGWQNPCRCGSPRIAGLLSLR